MDLCNSDHSAFNSTGRSDSGSGDNPGRRRKTIPYVAHFNSSTLPRGGNSFWWGFWGLSDGIMSLTDVNINGIWIPSNIHVRFGCMANLCNDLGDNRGGDRRSRGWADWDFLMQIVNVEFDRCDSHRCSGSKGLISFISKGRQLAKLVFSIAYVLNFRFNIIGGACLLQIVTPRRSGCRAH
jgi:hypothetical protein